MDALGETLVQLLDRPEALAFVLLLARLGPLIVFSPLFGGRSTPLRWRICLGAAFAAALTPLVGPVVDPVTVPAGEAAVLMLTAKELLVGATLAVLVSATFGLFAASGALIDQARGYAPPGGGENEAEGDSRLNVFFSLFFVTVFLAVGGHRLIFAAFGGALVRVPLGSPFNAGFATGANATAQIAALTGELFAAALQLALPIIAISLVVDVALGMLNRATGHIGAFFMGLTIKGILGVAVLLLVIRISAEEFLDAVPPLMRRLAEMR